MSNWEDQFRQWANPPGKTEQDKIGNAENAVKNAIKASNKLRQRNITFFTHGSYRNNTNVRQDSDVDIGVLCYDTFFGDYPEGTTRETFGNVAADYHYPTFKNEVEEALVSYFGRDSVKRGNKAFDIKENSYHIEADVAPFFEHRRYFLNGNYLSGVELNPDNGNPPRIINWPEQHYRNGVSKNNYTSRRYKSVVRIVKNLKNKMEENGISSSRPIIGFLIECLVWNIPDDRFGYSQLTDDVKQGLAFLYGNTAYEKTCNDWKEVSELKYLFSHTQKWTREQVNTFILDAWKYVGFS